MWSEVARGPLVRSTEHGNVLSVESNGGSHICCAADGQHTSRAGRERKAQGSHHLELGENIVHGAVDVIIHEDDDALPRVDHRPERRPLCALHGSVGRHVSERRDARSLESRGPDVREGEALRIREEECEDLVRVRVQPGFDGREVSFEITVSGPDAV